MVGRDRGGLRPSLAIRVNPDAPIVIVGSGMSGGVAAKTLREEGYSGRLVLIGHEPGVPFGRPPLSKTYLRGEEDLSGWLVKPPDWYQSNEVELVRATVDHLRVLEVREVDRGERREDGDDGDDGQQLDERERRPARSMDLHDAVSFGDH